MMSDSDVWNITRCLRYCLIFPLVSFALASPTHMLTDVVQSTKNVKEKIGDNNGNRIMFRPHILRINNKSRAERDKKQQ